MNISEVEHRRAFSAWLRTGRWSVARTTSGIQLKFNPYHDPENGQFTFAPGGPRSLSRVVISERRRNSPAEATPATGWLARNDIGDEVRQMLVSNAVYWPGESEVQFQPVNFGRPPRMSRGGNIRAFQDPMTLEQTFPGLRDAPSRSIIALADNMLDFSGPSRELTAELTLDWSNTLINQIGEIDLNYHLQSLGFPTTLQGQMNQIDGLRFDRATAFLRIKDEMRPLQVETLRFIQASANRAYERGIKLLRAGELKIQLSKEEALGNYIDREVRIELRERYGRSGIDWAGRGPVRVNRRENDSSGSELTFRRPDARVGNIAYDVTLTQKTLKSAQVRGFFNTDFRPSHVVIIRPRQVGPDNTYIITRPGTKR